MLEGEILVFLKDETKKTSSSASSTAKEDNPKPCPAQSLPADAGKPGKDLAGKDNLEFSCQSSSWE